MKTCLLSIWMLLLLSSSCLAVEVLIDENFEDSNRDGWYKIYESELAVQNDPALGSGPAVFMTNPNSTGVHLLRQFTPVVLQTDGQWIQVQFDVRANGSDFSENVTGFRLGFHSTAGTSVTTDRADDTTVDDDFGYFATVADGSTGPETRIYEDNGGSSLNGGGDISRKITQFAGQLTVSKQSVTYKITRQSDSIYFDLIIDGISVVNHEQGDTSDLKTVFDELVFSANGGLDLVLDNILVETNAEIQAQYTLFENFDTNPVAAGWQNQSTSSTHFTYNPDGYLDASIIRDSANRAMFCKTLPFEGDALQEAYWSMDVLYVSSANDFQQCLLGLFSDASPDNHHNVITDQFLMDNYNGTPRGNRNDIVVWDSAGIKSSVSGTPTSPGISYGRAVRVQQHYWHDGTVGKSELNVCEIKLDGSNGQVLMSAGPATVLSDGQEIAYNLFGLGNRTDGSLLSENLIKVDNLYFSTDEPNPSPVLPSFGGINVAGDYDMDGDVDLIDFAILSSRWLDACGIPDWCDGIDSDESGVADTPDLVEFAQNWMYLKPFSGYEIRVQSDIAYLGENRPKLDMYSVANPKEGDLFPGIVIIHGGGWNGGDKADSRELNIANTLVPEGYVCISINYELGSSSWPQNVYDCKSAIQYLRVNAAEYHIDPDNIGVIGGSAGGHLVCMLGYTDSSTGLEPPAPYPGVDSRVQAVVDMYGITDLLTRQQTDGGVPNGILKDGSAPTMLGCGRTECPDLWVLASPVTHVTPDDPPTLILHGTKDTTVDYDQSIELDSVLTQAGVDSDLHIIDGLKHSFNLQPSGNNLRPLVINFFDTYLKN